jgi:hypothetical protein
MLLAAVGKFEFLNDVRRQTAVFGHGEPLPFGPGTNLAAPLPARRRSCPGARPLSVHHARMFHKWSKLAAELAGMPGAQIDLVLRAVHAKLHGLVGRAASQVVLKMHFDPLHYLPPNCVLRLAADPKAELALRRHSLPGTDVSRTVPRPSQQTEVLPGSGHGPGGFRHWLSSGRSGETSDSALSSAFAAM